MYRNRIGNICILAAMMTILLLQTGCSTVSRGVAYGDSLFTNRDFDFEYSKEEAVFITFRDTSPVITVPEGRENCVGTEKLSAGESVIIKREGTYIVEGWTTCGSVVIDTDKNSKVQLVLNGVDMTCEEKPCIYVKNADKVFITLQEGKENILRDSKTEVEIDESKTESISDERLLESVIYSEDDIVFQGKGSLEIKASVRDGVYCENDIKITGGNYNIKTVHTAVKATDSIRIGGGFINIECGADALHVEEGYFYTRESDIIIKCVDDAIHSMTEITIADGKVDILKCREGLESNAVEVYGGKVKIDAEDDTINAFGKGDISPFIKIYDGELYLKSEGDCIDSNGYAVIEGGTVYMFSSAQDNDGAVDTIDGFTVLGGDVIAVEIAGVTDADIGQSGIRKITFTMEEACDAGSPFQVTDSNGETVFSVIPEKEYRNVFICSPKIKEAEYTATSGRHQSIASSMGR